MGLIITPALAYALHLVGLYFSDRLWGVNMLHYSWPVLVFSALVAGASLVVAARPEWSLAVDRLLKEYALHWLAPHWPW